MKTFIAALLLTSLPIQAATITFEDGSQVEFPDDWIVSIDIVAEQPPVECPEPAPVVDRTLRQRDLLTAPPATTAPDRTLRQRDILGYQWD